MKLTKRQLKKIINEELQKILQEQTIAGSGWEEYPQTLARPQSPYEPVWDEDSPPWETEFEKGAPPPQLPPAADVAGVEMIPGVDDDFFRSKGPYALRQGGTFHEPQVIIDPETGERVMLDPSIAPWEHDMQNELR